MEQQQCKNNSCEYNPTYDRELIVKPSKLEVRYARLWAEIELPKLLKERKQ